MKRLTTCLGIVVLALLSTGPALAESTWSEPVVSGPADRTRTAVTVYNADIGLVKEVRRVALPQGQGRIVFGGVPELVQPNSLVLRSRRGPGPVTVVEQRFAYNPIDRNRLLDLFIGQKVALRSKDGREIEGTLLAGGAEPIMDIDGRLFLGLPGTIILPRRPAGLRFDPALIWTCRTEAAGDYLIQASYLTGGLTWRADYSLTLNAAGEAALLTGWATVENRSGADYGPVELTLAAGDINRVRTPMRVAYNKSIMAEAAPAPAPPPEPRGVFEYRFYPIAAPVDLPVNQTIQLRLIADRTVEPTRILKAEFAVSSYRAEDRVDFRNPVWSHLRFVNAGTALPAGRVRFYQTDDKLGLQYLGEDALAHTPAQAPVEMKVGQAGEVICRRTETAFKKTGNRSVQCSWKIVVANFKDQPVRVVLAEEFDGDWKITQADRDHRRVGASRAEFDLDLAARSEVALTYTAKVER